MFIDYKRDLFESADGDKKEFLKDVTSFANPVSGHILVGMAATAGVPTDLYRVPLIRTCAPIGAIRGT
jgi:hypothetical protein